MSDHDFPPRMFAAGDEPAGIRVQAYHKSRGISDIIQALDVDEVDFIRRSSFGKLIDIAEKPGFSGRFLRFVLSRMLKVNKKHEIWFLFCGRPIRFSLREYAIVTGLPCGEFPKKSKRKLSAMISENSHWGLLFGTLKKVSVKTVVKMLRKKTVTNKEIRLKYAFLALLDSVVLPTTHKHQISKEHAEAIKDLDDFLAYPWGRLGFDLLLSSITDRNEVSLSQATIGLKGFVHAIQLVLVESVPVLAEVVQVTTNSDSESERDSDDMDGKEPRLTKVTLSPAHSRTVHESAEAIVDCIIPDDSEPPLDEGLFSWTDEIEDSGVDEMLRLISVDYAFNSSMFGGGITKSAVDRMRKEEKQKKDNAIGAKNKPSSSQTSKVGSSSGGDFHHLDAADVHRVVDGVSHRLRHDLESRFTNTEKEIVGMREGLTNFMSEIREGVDCNTVALQENLQTAILNLVRSEFRLLAREFGGVNQFSGDTDGGGPSNNLYEHCPVARRPCHTVPESVPPSIHVVDPLFTTTNPLAAPSFSLGLSQLNFVEPPSKSVVNPNDISVSLSAQSQVGVLTRKDTTTAVNTPLIPPSFSPGLAQTQSKQSVGGLTSMDKTRAVNISGFPPSFSLALSMKQSPNTQTTAGIGNCSISESALNSAQPIQTPSFSLGLSQSQEGTEISQTAVCAYEAVPVAAESRADDPLISKLP